MAFVRCNDVVQQVTAAALHPSLRDAILPRTFEGGSHRPNLQVSNRRWNFDSILAIPVKDQEPGSRFKRKRFPQLLDNPQARRVFRDIEMQNAPPIVADHEQAVQRAERDGWNREEVHRSNSFSVIAKKSQPAFGALWISRCSLHPTGNGPFRDIEPKHEKLAVDARRAPSRILGHQAEDQLAHFLSCLSSPNWPSHFGNQSPVQPKASLMPPDYRFRSHHDESLLPSMPEPSCQNPESPVQYCKSWPGMYSFQRRQLLTESEVLEKESATGVEQARDYSRHEPNDLYHVAVRNASGLWRATLQLVEIMGEQNFGEAHGNFGAASVLPIQPRRKETGTSVEGGRAE
jgi:hypothetical protein